MDDVELLSGLTWQLKGFQVDLPGASRTYHGLRLAQLVGSTLGWWVQLLPVLPFMGLKTTRAASALVEDDLPGLPALHLARAPTFLPHFAMP